MQTLSLKHPRFDITICDGCLTAAYDEDPRGYSRMDPAKAREVQIEMAFGDGQNLPDHTCKDPEHCQCGCRTRG